MGYFSLPASDSIEDRLRCAVDNIELYLQANENYEYLLDMAMGHLKDVLKEQTNLEKVAEFMVCGDQLEDTKLYKHKPKFPVQEIRDLRRKLIEEEINELWEAENEDDMVGVADALTDILYVVYGMGLAYGINLDKCFNEVHRSNMTKVVEGKLLKGPNGKVLKPDTYSPPDLLNVLGT